MTQNKCPAVSMTMHSRNAQNATRKKPQRDFEAKHSHPHSCGTDNNCPSSKSARPYVCLTSRPSCHSIHAFETKISRPSQPPNARTKSYSHISLGHESPPPNKPRLYSHGMRFLNVRRSKLAACHSCTSRHV